MATNRDRQFAKQQSALEISSNQIGERSPFNLEPSLNPSGMGNPQPYSLDVSIKPNSMQLDLETSRPAKGRQKSLELNFKGFGSREMGSPTKLLRGVENLVSRLGFGARNANLLPNVNEKKTGDNLSNDRNSILSQQESQPSTSRQVTARETPDQTSSASSTSASLPLSSQTYPLANMQQDSYSNRQSESGQSANFPNLQASNLQASSPQSSSQNWLGTKNGMETLGNTVPDSVSNNTSSSIASGIASQRSQTEKTLSPSKSPVVGIIDTSYAPEQHGNQVLEAISSANDQASFQLEGGIGNGGLANSLKNAVSSIQASGRPGVINISSDLIQKNPDGSETTRTALTANEDSAFNEAEKAGIPVVVSTGNQAESHHSWERAANKYNNLIVVGAANGSDKAAYSSYGKGMDVLAPGAQAGTPLTGTSLAAAEVTGTVSQMLAVNPTLKAPEVKSILKATATDLKTKGWDAETGQGLVNSTEAVNLASVVKELKSGLSSQTKIPASQIAFKNAALKTWNSSLDLSGSIPRPSTSGYEVTLGTSNKDYVYQTDRTGVLQELSREVGHDRATKSQVVAASRIGASLGGKADATTHINSAGLNLIKQSEGLRTKAYADPAGMWAIGYGHTGADVNPGDVVSSTQAESLLKQDVGQAESAVRSMVKVPLNSNQLSALTSLVYNIGAGNFAQSPVLKHLNEGQYKQAADALSGHNRAGGQVLPGLTKRRTAEKDLFLQPDAANDSKLASKPTTISGNSGLEAAKTDPRLTASNPKQKMLDTARSYIGAHEQGGDNRGPQVEKFQNVMNGAAGENWCMSFAQYCVKAAETATNQKSRIARSESCMQVWNNSPRELRRSQPEPGSLVIWQRNNSSSGHVGIVEKVNSDGTFTTIEGNTSSSGGVKRNGEGVYRKTRSMKGGMGDLHLRGFLKVF
jgi:lysozyme